MNQEKYEDTKLYVKINREEIEQYLKNSHSGINSVINGNINSTHFHLMSDKDLHDHDKELVAKLLKKVKRKVDNISMHTATKERLMIMCEEIQQEFEGE